MATKKKPAPKNIDLSKNKVSGHVSKAVRMVDRSLQDQISEINVPVFRVLKHDITVEKFFLNHSDFEALLGTNIAILDRMMAHAICSTLAEDLTTAIAEDRKALGYVGVWDQYTVYNIFAALVTFMKHDSKPEMYFTAHQYATISQEDLEKLDEGSYMPYSDYNPNRFYQVMIQLRNAAINVVAGIMSEGIPTAFIHPKDVGLTTFMVDTYSVNMKNDIELALKTIAGTSDEVFNAAVIANGLCVEAASERKITAIVNCFEKPFLYMISDYLKKSGLSQNAINMMLSTCRVHILYTDPKDKTMGEVGLTYILSAEELKDHAPMRVEYKTTIQDIMDMAILKDSLSKTKKENLGKPLRTFILDLCAFVCNIYMAVIRINNPPEPETAYINEAVNEEEKPVAGNGREVVQDMDVEDFDKILENIN